MGKIKVGLFVIFNHRYEKNISILNHIYKGRFSNVHYIMPFYDGDESNVITVYESSYYFESFITTAYNQIQRQGIEYDYYFFLPDDMILNPRINEDNFLEEFSIDEETALFSKIFAMRDFTTWPLRQFFDVKDKMERWPGFNWKEEVPEASEAFKIAEDKGIEGLELPIKYNFLKNKMWRSENIRYAFKYPKWFFQIIRGTFNYSYPLVNGFSDIFIIPSKYIKQFSKMSGVFGALNVHCEIALPTTVLLTCDKIKEIRPGNIEHGSSDDFYNKYEGDLNKLFMEFDENMQFIHPVKLSKWKY